MSFACQRDSFAKEFTTTVVSSKPAKLNAVRDGKKVTVAGFEVVYEDTILFPEGGGQNEDRGWVDDAPVLQVKRRGSEAVHFVETGVQPEVGQTVHQVVDWDRRFDHMQQHTGQHLVSALFEKSLNIPTMSWWLAENGPSKVGFSYVELGAEKIGQEQLDQIEFEANEAIRNHLEVQVKVFLPGDPELEKAKTRGLPDDHSGPVRVVEIGSGLDSNLCCGTHMNNLAQLQVVKLLYTENSKRKGNTNLFFLVGGRVLRHFDSAFDRERKFTEILSGGVDEHVALVEKLARNVRSFQKSTQTLAKELALKDAETIRATKPKYFACNRPESGNDYISCLVNELANEDVALLLSGGDEKSGSIQLVFTADETIIGALGQKLLKILDAKGGGKGRRLNAKFNSLKYWSEAEKLLQDHFKNES